MNEKTKNFLNVLLDIFIVLILIISVTTLAVVLTQKPGDVSHIFGYSLRSVQTNSMELRNEDGTLADGAFAVGDLIICKKPDTAHFNVGDTVMFKMPVAQSGDSYVECDKLDNWDTQIVVTHNIVEIIEENGIVYYRTQGIANIAADINLKTAGEILGVYTGVRISGVGKAIDFIQTSTGFLICIVLPILIFVIIQAIRVIRNFIAYKAQKLATEGAPSTGELTEEEKRRIAEEYMRQLASNNAQPSTGEAPAEGE